MKLKISNLPYAWIVLGLVFYVYMTTFQSVIFGSRMGGALFVLALAFLGVLSRLYKGLSLKRDGRWFWFALGLFSLFRNQDLLLDTETRWLLPMVGILLLFILEGADSWQDVFIKSVRVFTGIHAFFTVFFYIFKGLYLNHFVKLVPGAGEYLIGKFKEGCMPGITGHYSTNGIYLGIGVVFFASGLIMGRYKSRGQCYLEFAKTMFVLLALVLTSKRAHILFGVAACFVMYYVYNSDRKAKRLIYILGAVLCLIALVAVMMPFVPAIGRMVNRFIHADGGEITNGRIWFWEFALEKFRQSPLGGIGWGGFKHAFYLRIGTYSETSKYVDTHNVYLQLLCEQGLIGVSLFLGGVVSCFVKTWRLLKLARMKRLKEIDMTRQKYLMISLGIQSFFILYCFTGNCLYDCEFFYVYILCCALTYGVRDYLRSCDGVR